MSLTDISMSNVQEKLMAMSTIWYHDFCKIWIKNWLKIGMMVFLKQKVKVMNFFIDTDGKINLWTSQCYSPWIPWYWGPSCQFFTIDLAIKISRHMNIVTMLSYFLITVIVFIMIYHQIDFPRIISLGD